VKILIASPVQQKPEILRMFLYTVQHVRKPEDCEVHYHFVDDNELPESSAILRRFQASQPNVTIGKSEQHMRYVVDDSTHYWTEDNMERVGRMKDGIIRAAIDGGYDYVWFIDSDLLVHPDTLIHLLQADKDIISCIFWTKWREDGAPMPQVWQSDQYSMVRARSPARSDRAKQAEEAAAFLEMLKKPGIYEVGGLGACTLVSRAALVRGVRFEYIGNLSMPGEDRHFCIRAAALGFRLYVDTRTPAYHLYRPSDLEGGYRFIATHYQAALRRVTVSLCLVVKDDDEAAVERCLRSVEGIADETIVVDAGAAGRVRGSWTITSTGRRTDSPCAAGSATGWSAGRAGIAGKAPRTRCWWSTRAKRCGRTSPFRAAGRGRRTDAGWRRTPGCWRRVRHSDRGIGSAMRSNLRTTAGMKKRFPGSSNF